MREIDMKFCNPEAAVFAPLRARLLKQRNRHTDPGDLLVLQMDDFSTSCKFPDAYLLKIG